MISLRHAFVTAPMEKLTKRQQIFEVLKAGPMTALDLSRAVGIREKEVCNHLEHIRQSLRGRGERLRVHPSRCNSCGFEFESRRKLACPGRCPLCRSERISPPVFEIG